VSCRWTRSTFISSFIRRGPSSFRIQTIPTLPLVELRMVTSNLQRKQLRRIVLSKKKLLSNWYNAPRNEISYFYQMPYAYSWLIEQVMIHSRITYCLQSRQQPFCSHPFLHCHKLANALLMPVARSSPKVSYATILLQFSLPPLNTAFFYISSCFQ
jgi:hypothetical protein